MTTELRGEKMSSTTSSLIKALYNKAQYKLQCRDILKKHTTNSFQPMLKTADSDIMSCFNSAVHNVADINIVPCVYEIYNGTDLLRHPFMVRAGGNYHTPWTRDTAINTWQAVNFINPEVARSTLFAVCTKNEAGEPVIQPDVQTWDQIIWTIGAWNYYLSTGDEEFLETAKGIIERALKTHRENRFNKKYRLFRGGSFFNDGISGYPLECHDPELRDSFAPSHPVVETIMCLSTNCLYCEAYRIYGEIALHFNDNEEASMALSFHNELKANINRIFRSDELGRYRYILYPDGHYDDSQEASGHAFAVLFDIYPEDKQPELLRKLTVSERGVVSVWPPFTNLYSDSKPGRHNNLIWPFLNGMLIQAAAKCRMDVFAGEELNRITELYKNSKFRFFEIYSPYTGKEYGGWQVNRVWDSCRDQTWSATCYIGAFIHGFFGIRCTKDGVCFSPCIPENLKDSELSRLQLHGMMLTVKINGYGTKIEKFTLDGKKCEPFVYYDNKPHLIEITLK